MKKYHLIFTLTWCWIGWAAEAQMKTVTVDLHTGALTGSVPAPFDERFRLTGTADTQAERVSLAYGEVRRSECTKARVDPNAAALLSCAKPATALSRQAPDWVRNAPGAASFAFIVEPLEPNTCYAFRITQHVSPLTEDDRKKLRETLTKQFRPLVNEAFADRTFDLREEDRVEQKLRELAKETIKRQFIACLADDAIDLSTIAARDITTVTLQAARDEENAGRNVADLQKTVLKNLCVADCDSATKAWIRALPGFLAGLLADSSRLTPGAAVVWASPLNPTRDGHRSTTMAHMARAVASLNELTWPQLVRGELKFAGPTVEAATTPDPQSLPLLTDFLTVYVSDSFRVKTESGSEPVVSAGDAEVVRNKLILALQSLAAGVQKQAAAKRKLEETTLPDFLAGKVLERGFDISVTPTVITEGKNPYVGADAGVAYAGNVDKPFLYVGANFYTVPVNKDQPIPWRGMEGLRKRGSFMIGLTTGGLDGNNIKNFFGPGNPMAGVGVRFSRYIKASTGAVVFKQKDENPIVDRDHVEVAPFYSLSIDMDLRAVLGGVAKLFGQ